MKKWFSSDVNNLDDLKKEYRKLCFKHHPDMGGSTENMQAINSEYEQLLKVLINKKADSNYSEKSTFKNRDEEIEAEIRLREVLEKIEILDGLEIERIGLWLYVSGNTKAHKEALKEAGLKWAHARKL
ncbi:MULTISPECIES: molecular chaperone DnaJ [Acinetobacter calcoaceticus/baumannii complex]|nr:molecular chaperone DnaJ [Acinetobacter baumannii]MCD0292583.1 molecular chaperone DnaJ [Acinetobacter baumannii]MCD0318027.1 molecular chaperone DnaJ [Acinetobacter baumannii]MCD0332873.1 molecular chaperone DnaJ [Acinetobacter baumannii]MCD0351268.1 molecular chaperone DnaJ [Acinetobacter baumannii]MCD0362317.1 molecular chaperone DnaJ [Acinetobacter baumannii]